MQLRLEASVWKSGLSDLDQRIASPSRHCVEFSSLLRHYFLKDRPKVSMKIPPGREQRSRIDERRKKKQEDNFRIKTGARSCTNGYALPYEQNTETLVGHFREDFLRPEVLG
jgi:hypothetical protein